MYANAERTIISVSLHMLSLHIMSHYVCDCVLLCQPMQNVHWPVDTLHYMSYYLCYCVFFSSRENTSTDIYGFDSVWSLKITELNNLCASKTTSDILLLRITVYIYNKSFGTLLNQKILLIHIYMFMHLIEKTLCTALCTLWAFRSFPLSFDWTFLYFYALNLKEPVYHPVYSLGIFFMSTKLQHIVVVSEKVPHHSHGGAERMSRTYVF